MTAPLPNLDALAALAEKQMKQCFAGHTMYVPSGMLAHEATCGKPACILARAFLKERERAEKWKVLAVRMSNWDRGEDGFNWDECQDMQFAIDAALSTDPIAEGET